MTVPLASCPGVLEVHRERSRDAGSADSGADPPEPPRADVGAFSSPRRPPSLPLPGTLELLPEAPFLDAYSLKVASSRKTRTWASW